MMNRYMVDNSRREALRTAAYFMDTNVLTAYKSLMDASRAHTAR